MQRLSEQVRRVHARALQRGRSPIEAFEAAAEACRRADPSIGRQGAEQLTVGLLRDFEAN
jgi:hypothetical protein